MRRLYHFPQSTFSRRTRLALLHKGLDVELCDARADEAVLAEAQKLSPQGTMPVLVDDGRVLGDSTAIAYYLDLAYPELPLLWPRDKTQAHRAVAMTSLVDTAFNTLVEVGTRYFDLRNDPAWPNIRDEKLRRARAAIDEAASLVDPKKPFIAGDTWSIADIWTVAATLWFAGFPARASQVVFIQQMLTLDFRVPDTLIAWAKQHESHKDVRAVFG